jgi:hypothetical protein
VLTFQITFEKWHSPSPDENDMGDDTSEVEDEHLKASGIQPHRQKRVSKQKGLSVLVGEMLIRFMVESENEYDGNPYEDHDIDWKRYKSTTDVLRDKSVIKFSSLFLPDGEEDKKMLACPCCPTTFSRSSTRHGRR